MGEQVHGEEIIDPELNPEVARRRNLLFDKYVKPYLNMVYKLCINYTYNPSCVEENYNEVLVNFYRRIETYDPDRPITTWLHIVTKRHIAEIEKRKKIHDNKSYDCDIESFVDCDCYLGESGSTAMDFDNYREFYNDDILFALDQMKSIHKDAFLLQEAGYTLKEIADREFEKGTLKSHNIETVKSRLYFARQFLKSQLTRDGKRKTD